MPHSRIHSYFLLPTKWIKIFGENLKMVVARDPEVDDDTRKQQKNQQE
jgi:hypothetical protein